MKIIALGGDTDSGKTTTLNIVYLLFLQSGYAPIQDAFKDLENNDFSDVLEYSGRRIGIVTQGDYAIGAQSVKNHLSYLQSFECDIAICACTSGKEKIIRAVESYPDHRFLSKVKSEYKALERIENLRDATKIVNLVYSE